MDQNRSGGCLCGAIRYRLRSEPSDAGYCHCRMCQLASGAPVMAFASVRREDFSIERGDPVRRRSSDIGERWFCGECGTALAMSVSYQPHSIDFAIPTLDEPVEVPPSYHIWRESRIGWFDTSDSLPRHDRARRETAAASPEIARGAEPYQQPYQRR